MILSEHAHFSSDQSGICAHCGQPLPGASEPRYGQSRTKPWGLLATILLHLLLVLIYVLKPSKDMSKAAPPAGEAITYIAPLPGKPKKKELAASAPVKPVKRRPEVVQMERLPDTITLPKERRVEPEPKPDPKPDFDPNVSMEERIAARRRARGQATEEQAGEESEKERGMRNALANIAAANGKSKGDDRNDTGGVFSISDQSFSSAQLKFRGWNPSFKRRWLQQVDVQLGTERDIETAIVKKMIELIRKEKTGDFEWDSHRLQRVVKMSARPQDQAELEAFLYLEMFPGYKPPRTK
ncbi:MAG TPA: hypothetical protein VGC21_25170 [Telluria sp.]